MRIRLLLLVAVLAGLGGLRAGAQFTEPTQEELKMTEEAKSPGAAAIYLNYEESTDDKLHSKLVYVRIKVLTEKGKELATVEPWYYGDFKVEDIKARTIHADGTIVSLTGKPEELLVSKRGDTKINRKVFTLPSVEVGSILEYRYNIRYDDGWVSSPRWELQKQYYVRKAKYHFTPAPMFLLGGEHRDNLYLSNKKGTVNTLIWASNLPAGAKLIQDPTGRFDINLSDIPAQPDEDWMPPADAIVYYLVFYYSVAFDQKDFWVNESKDWSKEVDKFAEPTGALKAAVGTLVAAMDSETDKAKKLYKAVQALDNTDFSRQKGESERKALNLRAVKKAEDVWTQKGGESSEIALLYLALLRAAGIKAYDMRVVDRSERMLNWGRLDFDQFEDDIVLAVVDGKQTLLDPGQKLAPFEVVNWKHGETAAVVQTDKGPSIASSPAPYYLDNKQMRRGDVTISENGEATGTLNISMTGNFALRWRQLALRNDLEDVKKSFDEYVAALVPEGIEGRVDHFVGLDSADPVLLVVVNLKGVLGTATAKRLMLPGLFLSSRARHPFVAQAKRTQPIDIQYADQVADEIVYHLPAGLIPEGGVADTVLSMPGKSNFAIKARVTPTVITVARQLSRGFTVLKAEQYQELREYYQKIATADQQQIVLTRAAPAAGN